MGIIELIEEKKLLVTYKIHFVYTFNYYITYCRGFQS